ncbi:MAG: glycosyltransferase [Clostridia bacterium]|nr:glycosyltransferase [Clostridia bacterium]
MRLLILSCNTGAGHNTCSAAIRDIAMQNGNVCDVEDALRFISDGTSKILSKGHTQIYQRAPKLFKGGYAFTEQHRNLFREDSPLYLFFAMASQKIYTLCMEKKYDTILCTHPFSSLIVTDMMKRCDFSSHPVKTFFMATDYTCSPSVDKSVLDRYFIPDASLTAEFASLGIPEEKLIPLGIPIRSAFYDRIDPIEAKKAYGIPEDHAHLLVMCGSMGCGPMKKLIELLSGRISDRQTVSIICGTNQKLYRKLSGRYADIPNIHIYGFTSDVSRMMDSADLYLTKPGGLSVTEAAVKRLPMIFVNTVAGCEDHNLRFFVDRGAAKTADDPQAIADLCLSTLSSPETLHEMRTALSTLDYTHSAKRIYEYMETFVLGECTV